MDQVDVKGWMQNLTDLVSQWGLKVLGAVAVLIIGLMVIKVIRGSVRKGLTRANFDATLVPFLSSIVYYLLLVVLIIAVLGMFGVQTTSFIAVLGGAALAVGLALQGTLSNFASGVMLLIFRPFQVGDFIEAGGIAGSVKEIGIFSTTLNTPDNVRITIPNTSVYGQTIKNYSANDTRRVDMVFGIAYGDDINKAMEIIKSAVATDGRVLNDPEPVFAVSELGDSSVNIVCRPWCRKENYWGLKFDLTKKVKEDLEAGGCSIPFPQRDVHLFQETGNIQ